MDTVSTDTDVIWKRLVHADHRQINGLFNAQQVIHYYLESNDQGRRSSHRHTMIVEVEVEEGETEKVVGKTILALGQTVDLLKILKEIHTSRSGYFEVEALQDSAFHGEKFGFGEDVVGMGQQ